MLRDVRTPPCTIDLIYRGLLFFCAHCALLGRAQLRSHQVAALAMQRNAVVCPTTVRVRCGGTVDTPSHTHHELKLRALARAVQSLHRVFPVST